MTEKINMDSKGDGQLLTGKAIETRNRAMRLAKPKRPRLSPPHAELTKADI